VSEPGPTPPRCWRTPEELVAIGFERSRVVMMNEAHNGFLRSVRTREVGRKVLPAAHDVGVRHFAMEALTPQLTTHANATRELPVVAGGYLSQPEMRSLIESALALGWTLIAYEVQERRPERLDPMSSEAGNWRDAHQASILAHALGAMGADERLFVWCGNGHLTRHVVRDEWRPMAFQFQELTALEPFSIDQTQGVVFEQGHEPYAAPWVTTYAGDLATHGGVAGFLVEDAPTGWTQSGADAYVLLLDNQLS
jgi:hypothetical protein